MRDKLLRLFYEKGYFHNAIKIYKALIILFGVIMLFSLFLLKFKIFFISGCILTILYLFVKLIEETKKKERIKINNERFYQEETENNKIINV